MIIELLSLTILIYLSWALIHHKRDKSLTSVIILEYLLTALLSIVLLMGALF